MNTPGYATTSLELDAPATAHGASLLRRRFQDWLASIAPDRDTTELVLAVYEALANVAEHAYADRPGEPGSAQLRVHRSGDQLLITVCDQGCWRDQPATADGARGRGLMLLRELTTRTEIDPAPEGTTVTLYAEL